ncbi:unnamed protein product [Knipowitschia caucasica]
MVFFTCDACGESLKKAQVEKHVSHCRNCRVLCCIDCGKDFWGDDYKSHVRCISEDQKYGGKGFEAKANKGDVKQQQWLQRVHMALSRPGLSSSLQNVLQQVSAYDNVPRKKAKFQNWMRSSLRINSSSLQEQVWDILSAEAEKDTPPLQQTTPPPQQITPPQTTQQKHTNGEIENGAKNTKKPKLNKQERREARRNGAKKDQAQAQDQDLNQDSDSALRKKERKRKHRQDQNNETETKKAKTEDEMTEDPEEEEEQQEEQEEAKAKGKFNWKGNIRALLRETDDQELSVKKLRKKVLAAYYSFSADSNHKSQEEVLALFNKKINNNPKFRVLKDKVKLIK